MKLEITNKGFSLSGGINLNNLSPSLTIGGRKYQPLGSTDPIGKIESGMEISYQFSCSIDLIFKIKSIEQGFRFDSFLLNRNQKDVLLNEVTLLEAEASFPDETMFLIQNNYLGKFISMTQEKKDVSQGEPNDVTNQGENESELFSVCYDRKNKQAFLAGFLTSERFRGKINYDNHAFKVYFDGGDTLIKPSSEPIVLEAFCVLSSGDPQELLNRYGDLSIKDNRVSMPEKRVVSWCSWYPFRLSVSAENIIENAKLAEKRLKKHGMSFLEADLGWEKNHLPGEFEENSRFSCGLAKVSEELNKMGFDFGVWKAPYTISEFDPLVKTYPEWLIQDKDGKPMKYWEWFWEPHGDVYILDLTHPGAQEHLRNKMTELYEKGVRYFKSDFINCVSDPKARIRYNPYIAAGGTLEMARIGQKIIKETMKDSLLLNCGGPEGPSVNSWPLLYTCNDTGNTGFINMKFQHENLVSLATHLFKNNRWGVVQSSCICVGLPGTREEAQIRATAAYMTGGQIDISDDLTTLPEDRWQILLASLPQPRQSAEVIDLFDPLVAKKADYVKMVTNQEGAVIESFSPIASTWKQAYKTDWDSWVCVALFSFGLDNLPDKQVESRFTVPYSRLGLKDDKEYVGFEFWSGQYLGPLPGGRFNENGYEHPGDYQELLLPSEKGTFTTAFFGPAVKLIRITEKKRHPFVVGTTFHQSGGTELSDMKWDGQSKLSFTINRPCGESGAIFIEPCGSDVMTVKADGRKIPHRCGSKGCIVIAYTCEQDSDSIEVEFKTL